MSRMKPKQAPEATNFRIREDQVFNDVLYNISDGIITTCRKGIIERLNLVAEKLTGWQENQARGKLLDDVIQIMDQASQSMIEIPYDIVLEQGLTCELMHYTLLISKNKKKLPVTCVISPVKNEREEIVGLVIVFHDLREEKRVKNELIESEYKFRTLLDQAAEMLFLHDSDGNIIEVNQAAVTETGYSKEELLLINIFDIDLDAADRDDRNNFWAKTILEKKAKPFQTRHRRKDGSIYPAEVTINNVLLKDQNCILALARNISERLAVENARKKSEEELLKSRQTFFDLYNSVSEAIYIQDNNGVFLDVNKGAEEMYGYSREELRGKTPEFVSAMGFNNLGEIAGLLKQVFDTGKPVQFEFYGVRKNGEIFPKDVIVNKGKFFDKDVLITTGRDISESKRIQNSLKESQQMLQAVLNTIPVRVFWKDENLTFLGCNKSFALDAGLNSPEEIIGKSDFDMVWKEQAALYRHDDNEVIKSGKQKLNYEEPQTTPDGSKIILKTSKIPLKDINNETIGVLGAYEDITEKKKIEVALKKNESRFRALIYNAPDGIVLLQKNSAFSYMSPSVSRILGYGSEDAGINPDTITHPDDLPAVHEEINKIMNTPGKVTTIKYRLMHKKGDWRWLESTITNLLHDPAIEALVFNFRDITEQINHEEEQQNSAIALSESETRYRLLIETMNDGVMQVNNSDQILFVNQRICEIFGYRQEELLGKTGHKTIIHKDDQELIKEKNRRRQKSITEHYEVRGIKKSGELIWVSISASPTFDLHGNVTGSVGVLRDITDRKNSEIALKESEAKYRTLFESANDAIFLMQGDTFVDCNARTEIMFRCRRNEILNRKPFEFSPVLQPNGRNSTEEALKRINAARNGSSQFFEWQHKALDGTLFDAEVALNQVVLQGRTMLQAIVRDITSRKRAELTIRVQYKIAHAMVTASTLEELFETVRAELNLLINSTNFYIVFYDPQSGMLTSPFEKDEKDNIPMWPAENSITGLVVKHAKPLLLNKQEIKKLADEGKISLRGSRAEAWLGVPMRIGQKVLGAIVVQCYNDPNAYNQSSVEVLELIANQVSLYIEKKQHEEDLLIAKEKAEESDRLKTAFLNNMSHEIRTPLNGVLGFVTLLTDPASTSEEREYFARIINQSSNQLLAIINDIINISTIEAGQEKLMETETDVNEVLQFVFDQTKTKVDAERVMINYRSHIAEEPAIIKTDKTKLIQILSNLIGNAVKFTHKGIIEIECRQQDGFILFTVEDSGIGIAPEFHELIFERFRQASSGRSREYGGNGLGLAISKAYVELMGGQIWVESEPGQGAKFHFTITYKPLKQSVAEPESTLTHAEKTAGNRTILYAEDDYSNFILVDILLQSANYKVIHVNNGQEAIEECRRNQSIDLVLMDLKMPAIDGFDATRIIKSIRPELPVIAITALALSGDREKAINAGCNEYISKPLKKEMLLKTINMFL
jgi:PAS domain S-box-containing protein